MDGGNGGKIGPIGLAGLQGLARPGPFSLGPPRNMPRLGTLSLVLGKGTLPRGGPIRPRPGGGCGILALFFVVVVVVISFKFGGSPGFGTGLAARGRLASRSATDIALFGVAGMAGGACDPKPDCVGVDRPGFAINMAKIGSGIAGGF